MATLPRIPGPLIVPLHGEAEAAPRLRIACYSTVKSIAIPWLKWPGRLQMIA